MIFYNLIVIAMQSLKETLSLSVILKLTSQGGLYSNIYVDVNTVFTKTQATWHYNPQACSLDPKIRKLTSIFIVVNRTNAAASKHGFF